MQMGKALTIITRASVRENIMHADIGAFGAPSECHGLVSKGEVKREREARRMAKAASGLSRRQFNVALKKALTLRNRRALDRLWYEMNLKMNPFI